MANFNLVSLRTRSGIDAKALGRGIGSGCGKTCGYGHKGGKARSGRGTKSWFEGGQMPIYRRLPKRGFNSYGAKKFISIVNIDDIQSCIDNGFIKDGAELGITDFKVLGLIRDTADKVRILGRGEIKASVNIVANYISGSALKAVESVGGKVKIVE